MSQAVQAYELCDPGQISQADLDKLNLPLQMKQYKASKDTPIHSIKQIRQKLTDGSTYEVVFDTGASGLTYITGANSAIFPENSEEDVQEFARLLKFGESTLNKAVCLRPNPLYTGTAKKLPLPIPAEGMTVKDILTKLIDFHDKLTQKEFGSLAECCKEDLA